MIDRDILCHGIKRIAWAYVFLSLNINLSFGSSVLNLLPNWVGYLIILNALLILREDEPSSRLLSPLGILLCLWELAQWFLALAGLRFGGYGLDTVAVVISLYFHFQLLTDLVNIARRREYPLCQRLLRLRSVRTILATLFSLPLPWETVLPLTIIMSCTYLVLLIWICRVLFSLHNWLLETPCPPSPAPN